jgi:cytochrome c-type biogenesis protein
MIGGIEHLVESGPLLLAMPVALAAGAVTFLSPCCLPLVPGYLSYLTGMSGSGARGQGSASPAPVTSPSGPDDSAFDGAALDGSATNRSATNRSAPAASQATGAGAVAAAGAAGLAAGRSPGVAVSTVSVAAGGGPTEPGRGLTAPGAGPAVPPRGRAVLGTLLFVLGFAAVFTVEGAAFGTLGLALRNHQKGLTQVLGCAIILLGLLFLGAFDRFTFTGRIFRPQYRPRAGLAGAPLLGATFGLGWIPCIGPTLTAVLTLGTTTGDAGRGALLAFVYALGLGIPFLIVAFAFQRGVSLFSFARRHARLVTQLGGLMLITVGLLEVTGAWATAVIWLQTHWFTGYNAPI